MLDSRRYISKILHHGFNISLKHALSKFLLSLVFALLVAFVPSFEGLSAQGVFMLFIIVFAAGLWVSEAVPVFAVSFLIIALEIVLLGFENFNFSSGSKEWTYFLKPWSSPLVFLFLAGFILAIAASKTKLDLWLAKKVLFYFGNKPANLLTGLMLTTFVLSMFVSNTATTAMMMTMLLPILRTMHEHNPFQKALLLGVVVAANIGGMGTIIGTPPNAIAIGILGERAPSFVEWMALALPPALLLTFVLRLVILKRYPSSEKHIDISQVEEVSHYDESTTKFTARPSVPSWKKSLVIGVFALTIGLWLTGPFHHVPTPVISLLPIVVFTLFGIIDVEDIKEIRWDVIILIIGGLSLGLGVGKTGLDAWLGSYISLDNVPVLGIIAVFAGLIVLVSNFMSNTAATNIMLPLVVALISAFEQNMIGFVLVSLALCASCAMVLPVSTPPNAIAFASGKLPSNDFVFLGVLAALIGPVFIVSYLYFLY